MSDFAPAPSPTSQRKYEARAYDGRFGFRSIIFWTVFTASSKRPSSSWASLKLLKASKSSLSFCSTCSATSRASANLWSFKSASASRSCADSFPGSIDSAIEAHARADK